MDFLATPARRKLLFASLYFSEGAPIGFIWLALPTRFRAAGMPVEQITWLTAMLVLPWTFKFAWAPLVDVLQTSRWTLRHWIIAAQTVMGLALLPLIWLDPIADYAWLAALLLVHALAAATQDVSIDAMCISVTDHDERGRYNGWMQAGMLLGRALMGGGALVMSRYLGGQFVVMLLVVMTTFSMLMVFLTKLPAAAVERAAMAQHLRKVVHSVGRAMLQRNTWIGLAFALTGGAAFKSLEVVYGPFLVDRGFSEDAIGWFSAGPMIATMIVGSLAGGWLADRFGHRRCVGGALLWICAAVGALAASDLAFEVPRGSHLLILLATTAFGIGVFTASSYALFMDISDPTIAATQFSAFMGATNGCEAWSSYTIGRMIAAFGYPPALIAMSAASLAALPLLAGFHRPRR